MRRPEGRIHLAGSDFANGLGGFIDGAIESGLDAARGQFCLEHHCWRRRQKGQARCRVLNRLRCIDTGVKHQAMHAAGLMLGSYPPVSVLWSHVY
ncbi:FAD-dependent oxidoreductase [Glutamicibacter sp. TV12E]|uniref:FAD-dependent oxidoreductase n=1 Tax=Glutamicibacter sp. TV12E TaxID=3446362 RepID=UPI00403376AA